MFCLFPIDDSTKNRRRSLQDEARRLSAQFDDPYEDTRRRSIQSTFSSQNASSAVPGMYVALQWILKFEDVEK